MVTRILVSDSVGKVLKIFHFYAVFHDSAIGCTKLRLEAENPGGNPLPLPTRAGTGPRMSGFSFQPSLLARDRKLFLELTPEEADVWITRVFDRIRPHMHLISSMVFNPEERGAPLNLEAVLFVASPSVREVAVEMANVLLTPERQQQLFPLLNAYCDELLAQGRALDATFVQQGLIDMLDGKFPGQNTLLVEVCLRGIYHQVSLINSSPRMTPRSH